jgi:hypothetical protein
MIAGVCQRFCKFSPHFSPFSPLKFTWYYWISYHWTRRDSDSGTYSQPLKSVTATAAGEPRSSAEAVLSTVVRVIFGKRRHKVAACDAAIRTVFTLSMSKRSVVRFRGKACCSAFKCHGCPNVKQANRAAASNFHMHTQEKKFDEKSED